MILDFGVIDFEKCLSIQKELVRRRRLGEIDDSLILAEHRNVFTIGRTGKIENLLVEPADLKKHRASLIFTDRGGDITFHGPGQVVLYPIIDLRNRNRDLHGYLRDLEDLVINLLSDYGVSANRMVGATGVWFGSKKIGFIGVSASGWVTYHGASININTDLSFFSMCQPCGLKDVEVTSLKRILGKEIAMDMVKNRIVSSFEEVFTSWHSRKFVKSDIGGIFAAQVSAALA